MVSEMSNFVRRSRWTKADWGMAAIGLAIAFMWLVGPFLGWIEGALRPVATQFEVHSNEPVEGGTSIWGKFRIDRPACHFQRIEWVLQHGDRMALIDISYGEGTRVRDGGWQDFGPWFLTIPPVLLGETKAVVLHQCPWRPWLTRTHLFP